MMSGKLEGDTNVKEWNLGLLLKDRNNRNFKEGIEVKSSFRLYKEAIDGSSPFKYPHEEERIIIKYHNFLMVM